MLTWIFIGIAIYVAGLFLPSLFLMSRIGIPSYFGTRDDAPSPSVMHARSLRAHRNFLESLPVFLAFGFAAMVVSDADIALATTGAMLFVIARALFLPLYLLGVPWLRSAAWSVGFVALLLMGYALI